MKKYQVLIRESLSLSTRKYDLQMKMCYNNIFNFCLMNGESLRSKKYKICYGFVKSKNMGLGIRHAFLLDTEKNKILDPTLKFFIDKEYSNYYIFKIFEDSNEYFNYIIEEEYPALYKSLEKDQKEFQKHFLPKDFNVVMDVLPMNN